MTGGESRPRLLLIAGPNGVGKSTTRHLLLAPDAPVIDPDVIARTLNPDRPEDAAVAAGRQAVARGRDLIAGRRSFAWETTLTGNSPLRLADNARQAGYEFELLYIGTPDWRGSRVRVDERVRKGGHDIPTRDLIRRFDRSLGNLARAVGKAIRGALYDNSGGNMMVVGAIREGHVLVRAGEPPAWFRKARLGFETVTDDVFRERIHPVELHVDIRNPDR